MSLRFKDPELQQLQKVVMDGWLQISCYQGLTFKGDRIKAPHSLRPEILHCIYMQAILE